MWGGWVCGVGVRVRVRVREEEGGEERRGKSDVQVLVGEKPVQDLNFVEMKLNERNKKQRKKYH